MRIIQLTFFLVISLKLILSSIVPHDGPLIAEQAPIVKLDLNVEPLHRWDHIIPEFKDIILEFMNQAIDALDIDESVYNKIGFYMNNFYKYQSYLEEMKGIANNLGIRWEKVLLGNFFYEGSTLPLCSSILVKDKFNKVMHARNLDFPFWEYLSKMTAKVKVYKGDKFLGTWDQVIGSVIVLSGQNVGKFSVTVDTRFTGAEIDEVVKNIFIKQYIPSAYLTRQVLENELNYEDATFQLMNTNVTAPIYYIIGGTEDGMIIEKKSEGYKNYHDFQNVNNWFLVQTNYDWDVSEEKDVRRTAAYQRIEEIGQESIDKEKLMEDVLKLYPTLNVETIYSLIYSAEYRYDDLNLWYGNVDSQDQKMNWSNSYEQTLNAFGESMLQYEERIKQFVNLISSEQFFENLEKEYKEQQKELKSITE